MSKYLVPCAIVLVLHIAAVLGVRPYSDMIIAVGLHLVRANDVADLLNVVAAGAALVGGVLLGATVGVVYAVELARSAD
jgi:hypothetical protein